MRRRFLVLALVAALAGCKGPLKQNLPPAELLMHPGPGVDGPGPGVMSCPAAPAVPMVPPAGLVSQVAFVGPEGMSVRWDVTMPGAFDSMPLVAPGRFNFPQGAIYRLKLEQVPGRPGVELYPTLEVGLATPRTAAFLAHNTIPVQFTEEDFDQVLSGNFVTKVIYLPDPEFQELALAGVETLVSTRLDPGVDPIVEADRRGAILGILRVGNKDLEVPSGMEYQETTGETVVPTSYNEQGQPVGVAGVPGTPLGMSVLPPGPMPPGMPMGSAPGGPCAGGACPVGGYGAAGAAGALPTNYIAGVTGPQYGMPMCGTPIGLPGPPHVPLGIPAGLQSHRMRNHTMTVMPGPTEHVKIDVRQDPGFSYPRPANHAYIVEQTRGGGPTFIPPRYTKREVHTGGEGAAYGEGYCPPEAGQAYPQ